ncbi:MAG: ParB/RepB/Spo0J family partition protein [Deltaproteobacteria bacterium]|nr:ParB/RepB/Spo0J family partition protein [Deltaproteobacteria bacterium]
MPVADIAPNPEQPRRRFEPRALKTLADSIRRHGVLQPVVVRHAPPGATARFELVVGERRWRAAKQAGRRTLPATIQETAPDALLELALVENVQRADLNALELAHAFRALAAAGWTQEQMGRRLGLARSSVANHLRLLDLSRELQEEVETGALSPGHAKALLGLTAPAQRRQLRRRIAAEGLSVRQTEDAARHMAPAPRRGKRARRPAASAGAGAADVDLRDLVRRLETRLQAKVRIPGAQRGKLEVSYHSPEELHRIAEAILEAAG